MPEQPAHVHLLLPPEMRDRLCAVAERQDRSVTAEVRVAVREHLERETAHASERSQP